MPAGTAALFAALGATWPAEASRSAGGFTLRDGAGGGSRVSAATLDAPPGDVAVAEAAMRAGGARPLFMLRPGEDALDAALAGRGYALMDPTSILTAPAATLAPAALDPRAIRVAAPLAVMDEIWEAGGIGPARHAVMARVRVPRIWLMARDGDRPAGCAFVAAAGPVAMLHALEIAPAARRRGLGTCLTRAAAAWALAGGAQTLALAVTRANAPALGLYRALGFGEAAGYHYRIAPD